MSRTGVILTQRRGKRKGVFQDGWTADLAACAGVAEVGLDLADLHVLRIPNIHARHHTSAAKTLDAAIRRMRQIRVYRQSANEAGRRKRQYQHAIRPGAPFALRASLFPLYRARKC